MIRIALVWLLLLGALPALGAEEASPHEMVLLTVGGEIGKTNRGPLDPKKDSLLALDKITFDKGFAFDRPMLLALPQGSVTAQPREFDRPATFKGPLLKDLLRAVDAAEAKITYTAVNGYSGWLDPKDVEASDWIVAIEADGVPLGVGQQGPLWLINTRSPGETASDDHRGHWVWALFYIKVGD